MRRKPALAASIVAAFSIALVGAAPAGAAATHLRATLSGADEAPEPGDPDGSGDARIDLKQKPAKKNGKVCFTITHAGIDPPTAGHIHEGAPGTAGPIVVPLFDNPSGEALPNDCVKAKRSLIKRIAKHPEDFYVNLHNGAFPAGAIRGQLTTT